MSAAPPYLMAHARGRPWEAAAGQLVAAFGPVDQAIYRLGFLYVTDAHADAVEDIAAHLRRATGVPHWVGTVGFGICATGTEYFDEPAMAAMIAPLAENTFRIFALGAGGIDSLSESHRAWLEATAAPLAIVHADPANPRALELLNGLAATTGGYLVGGLTASRGRSVQLADIAAEGEISGVLLSLEAVPVQAGLTQGCTPIGPVRSITEAHENLLIRIDDRPALEVFKEEIGDVLARDLRRVAGYIFAALPVSGSDTGDYMVRNLVGIDPQRGIVAIGERVEEGGRIMFCRRDHDSAVEDMRRMLSDLKRRTGGGTVRGGLYVSCVARGPNQFGPGNRELGLIREELGDFPLVGFFANGEINNDRLYGYTGVLTLFL